MSEQKRIRVFAVFQKPAHILKPFDINEDKFVIADSDKGRLLELVTKLNKDPFTSEAYIKEMDLIEIE